MRDHRPGSGEAARLLPYRLRQSGTPSIHDLTTLRDAIDRLERAEAAGTLATLLEDRTIGLLAGYGTTRKREAASLEDAWTRLGARVSSIDADLLDAEGFVRARYSALELQQMYDAVACQGVAPHWVRQLRSAPGLLIIEDLASPTHPIAAYVDAMPQTRSPEAISRLVLQAALVNLLR